MSDWSSRISGQFNLSLPADVIAWFDDGLWKESSETRFGQPLEPESLLRPESAAVWGGQMLPDTLPILDNGCGDVLCLRFNSSGAVSEVVQWMHEEGSWAPYGASLSEALLLDAAMTLMEWRLDETDCGLEEIGYANWALNWLEDAHRQSNVREILRRERETPITALLETGIAEAAIRRALCQRCCTSRLLAYCQTVGGNRVAAKLGVPWPVFSQWLFDAKLVPEKMKTKLAKVARAPVDELLQQDWDGAVREAEAVVALRTDLSWPFAVLGWAAERQGDLALAIQYYCAGLKALGTTSDFTESWGTSGPGQKTKFVVERLKELDNDLPGEVLQNDYLKTAIESKHSADFFHRIRKHWCASASLAEKERRFANAYEYYYRAGWDIYAFDDMENTLDCLVRNAEAAGWPALARIARHHRESLLQ